MSEEKNALLQSENDIVPQEPQTEEEAFGIVGTSKTSLVPVNKSDRWKKKGLGGKELSAYNFTWICVVLVVGMWVIDFFFSKSYGSEYTETVIDLLKYVITASLSFFFGTSVKKNDGSN